MVAFIANLFVYLQMTNQDLYGKGNGEPVCPGLIQSYTNWDDWNDFITMMGEVENPDTGIKFTNG